MSDAPTMFNKELTNENLTLSQDDGKLLGQVDRTDAGNVALLFKLAGTDIKFVHELKRWIVWDGQRWQFDKSGSQSHPKYLRVSSYYKDYAAKLRQQAQDQPISQEEAKKINSAAVSIEKWANQCKNKKGIDAMIALAQRDPRFVIDAAMLDADPWLVGARNGVINLKTGALSPDSRSQFVLKRCPVEYDPQAKAPRWTSFIEEITGKPILGADGKMHPLTRTHLSGYLQKALGYCLTGSTAEQVMFIAIGRGANGKNVLLDTFKSVAGDYAETIAPEVLMATKFDSSAEQASPSARKLAGARCAISSESKDGQRLDIAVVKRHTGGGYMTARSLHENPVTFEITHKLWLMTNHTPRVDHMDDATKGRLHIIPFDMKWNRPSETRPDPALPNAEKNLMTKLNAELPGILVWLVEGTLAYLRDGLLAPPEIASFTQAYIDSQDLFSQFLETCAACDVKDGTNTAELFEEYRRFCRAEDETPQIPNSGSFGKRLKAMGYQSTKFREGNRFNLKISACDSDDCNNASKATTNRAPT